MAWAKGPKSVEKGLRPASKQHGLARGAHQECPIGRQTVDAVSSLHSPCASVRVVPGKRTGLAAGRRSETPLNWLLGGVGGPCHCVVIMLTLTIARALGSRCLAGERADCARSSGGPGTYVTKPIRFCDMSAGTVENPLAPDANGFVRYRAFEGLNAAARQRLSRAAKSGELLPVRPGLYYRGVKTQYGMVPPRPIDVARAIWGERGIGPSGFSAAREWGLTSQIPTALHVATLWTVAEVKGIVQHSRKNQARHDLNWKEIALLELLRDMTVYVEAGWGSLAEKVLTAQQDGSVNLERIESALQTERRPTARRDFATLMGVMGGS